MKQTINKFLIAFLILCTNHHSLIAQSPNLDGNAYIVELKNQTLKGFLWKEDRFIFEDGQMHSVTMLKQEGFKAASYAPVNQGDVVKFTYDGLNKYGSSLKIEGTAKGKVIEGTIVWKSDAGVHEYTFTGRRA